MLSEIKQAIRDYCATLSDNAISQSSDGERIYFAGLSLDELAGAIADRLRSTPCSVPDGWRLVPVWLLEFLDGAAPAPNGKWFGELEDEGAELPKPYWWRKYLRAALSAAPPAPEGEG